jgi:hypothetical protein
VYGALLVPYQNVPDIAPEQFIENIKHGATRKPEDGIDIFLLQCIEQNLRSCKFHLSILLFYKKSFSK